MTTETLSKFVLPSAAIPMCGQTNGQLPNCVYERKVLGSLQAVADAGWTCNYTPSGGTRFGIFVLERLEIQPDGVDYPIEFLSMSFILDLTYGHPSSVLFTTPVDNEEWNIRLRAMFQSAYASSVIQCYKRDEGTFDGCILKISPVRNGAVIRNFQFYFKDIPSSGSYIGCERVFMSAYWPELNTS